MDIERLVEDITSRDTDKVRRSSWEVICNGQNPEQIRPLIKYLREIEEKTRGLEMGGAFAPNQRFVDFAIKTIEFHCNSTTCSCKLYELVGFDLDPKEEAIKGYVRIRETVLIDSKWPDYYDVQCVRCAKTFKVIERDGHFVTWQWLNQNSTQVGFPATGSTSQQKLDSPT